MRCLPAPGETAASPLTPDAVRPTNTADPNATALPPGQPRSWGEENLTLIVILLALPVAAGVIAYAMMISKRRSAQ